MITEHLLFEPLEVLRIAEAEILGSLTFLGIQDAFELFIQIRALIEIDAWQVSLLKQINQ